MNKEPFSTEPGLIYRMRYQGYFLIRNLREGAPTNDYPRFSGLFLILARKDNMIQILTKKGIFWMSDHVFMNPIIYDKLPLELITDV